MPSGGTLGTRKVRAPACAKRVISPPTLPAVVATVAESGLSSRSFEPPQTMKRLVAEGVCAAR